MSLLDKCVSNSLSADSDEKETKSYEDELHKLGLSIAELAKQLRTDAHTQNIQSQLVSIDKLEKACKILLHDLKTLKASLTATAVESKPMISLSTVECYNILCVRIAYMFDLMNDVFHIFW